MESTAEPKIKLNGVIHSSRWDGESESTVIWFRYLFADHNGVRERSLEYRVPSRLEVAAGDRIDFFSGIKMGLSRGQKPLITHEDYEVACIYEKGTDSSDPNQEPLHTLYSYVMREIESRRSS